jgi:hypothetical protein
MYSHFYICCYMHGKINILFVVIFMGSLPLGLFYMNGVYFNLYLVGKVVFAMTRTLIFCLSRDFRRGTLQIPTQCSNCHVR